MNLNGQIWKFKNLLSLLFIVQEFIGHGIECSRIYQILLKFRDQIDTNKIQNKNK